MINQHHEEELKHECQVCKKVTPGVLPYLAAKENLTKKHFYFCVKKFISGSHLSRHSRIHNGIQPNRQCMICYKVKVLVLEPCIIIHFHSSSITWFYFKIVFWEVEWFEGTCSYCSSHPRKAIQMRTVLKGWFNHSIPLSLFKKFFSNYILLNFRLLWKRIISIIMWMLFIFKWNPLNAANAIRLLYEKCSLVMRTYFKIKK